MSYKNIITFKKVTILLVVIGGVYGYFAYTGNTENLEGEDKYTTMTAKLGSISTAISGNGQVSTYDEISIKSKISGEIIYLDAKNSEILKKGDTIARIDDVESRREIRDAEIALETANLDMEKLLISSTDIEIAKAANGIIKAENNIIQLEFDYKMGDESLLRGIEELERELPKQYEDAFNTISEIFVDLPAALAEINDVIFSDDIKPYYKNISYYSHLLSNSNEIEHQENLTIASYNTARREYDEALSLYQSISRVDVSRLEELTYSTYTAVHDLSQSLKEISVFLALVFDKLNDIESSYMDNLEDHIDIINNNITIINPHLSKMYNSIQIIEDTKNDIIIKEIEIANLEAEYLLDKANLEFIVDEAEQELEDSKSGPDELDIRSQEIVIKQRENALSDAKQDLANYYVYMPFNGVISDVNVTVGDIVSSSTVIVDAISNQKIANITLNEIDIVKVEVDKMVVLTFDAVDDLSITGKVIEIDTVGDVASGVVSYDVRIAFDIDDSRIKSGMSTNANIIIESKQDVITVPNAAIKAEAGAKYVEILVDGEPVKKTVEVGTANDIKTEILSGIKVDDKVITSTTSVSTAGDSDAPTMPTEGTGIPGTGIPGTGSGGGGGMGMMK